MAVLAIRHEDHVLVLTLDRPEAKNALDPELIVRLGGALRDYARDDSLRCAILTGTGDTFCSGADLGRTIPLFTGARAPEDDWDAKLLGDMALSQWALLRGVEIHKPILAAVNGHAIAGGFELLLGTDIRIAAEEATFALQEPRWGLFPAGGSTVRLPRQVPYARAMEVLLTGDRFSAADVQAWGLVNAVVPRSEVLPRAREVAARIAENGPLAVRKIKESVLACLGRPEEEALAEEIRHAAPVFSSRDAREGPRAFREKRKPDFRGE